jgi:hypothetical protein
MSKSELTYTLKTELTKVNKVIDQKIVRGLPYTREARYHKNLLNRLALIRQKSWLARSMRYVGAMMF